MTTTINPTRLIPVAARTGYVPVTDLEWLESLRGRHEQLAERLKEAVRGPDDARREHAARVAAWQADVRAAAWAGVDPPAWSARLGDDWLAGRVDAAEAAIVGLVGEIFEVLREADVACDEHGIDARIESVDDGYGGALVALEQRLGGAPATDKLPSWAVNVRVWREWRNQRDKELLIFGRRDGGAGLDRNPYGGAVHGTTVEDHAAEERARVERARNTAAEQLAAANTTNDEQGWAA